MKKCSCNNKNPRLNKVGGQAVLEGVMMKAGENCNTACRKEDGSIIVVKQQFRSIRNKHKFLNIPILRGIVGFFETMKLSVSTLNASAEAAGIEEEVKDTKTQKWLKKHFGIGITEIVMFISVILGVALAVGLFIVLPAFISSFIIPNEWGTWQAITESVIKILIFISYLLLISLMPDIKRTFMYHGAEHKSIACYESGEELTPQNAIRHTRFHPRCGTSFMFFMILLGIFAGILIKNVLPGLTGWQYTLIRILILPLVVGVGYEFIIYAGKHNNIFVRVLSAPGLWVQRITTKEPDEKMLEVAITALKCSLPDEFPDFENSVAHYDVKSKLIIPAKSDLNNSECEVSDMIISDISTDSKNADCENADCKNVDRQNAEETQDGENSTK